MRLPDFRCSSIPASEDPSLTYANQQRTRHVAVIVDFQKRIFRNVIDREFLLRKQRMAGSAEKINVAGFGKAFVIEARISESFINYCEVHFAIN